MKAYDIYKRTLALMFEREGEDSAFYDKFIDILNALICEALPYENSVRAGSGKSELAVAPEVGGFNDEVDMCADICGIALPYGVAAYFSQDDGEVYNASMYRERFINALNEAARYRTGEVIDVYGGENI